MQQGEEPATPLLNNRAYFVATQPGKSYCIQNLFVTSEDVMKGDIRQKSLMRKSHLKNGVETISKEKAKSISKTVVHFSVFLARKNS